MRTADEPWTWTHGRRIAIQALVVAAILLPVAALASACASCGEFHDGAVFARAVVEFSPLWLLAISALA
jgi:hypothetical protein